MSEAWYGRPERTRPDLPDEQFFQNPPKSVRTNSYPSVPRHGAPPAQHRNGSRHGTGEWRPPQPPAAGRTRRLDASPWNWLLLVPIALPLMPGLYNRMDPALFGLPFYYWSQLGFAFLATSVITFVHLKVR